MKRAIFMLIVLGITILTGCNQIGYEKMVVEYLENLGYEVVNVKEEKYKFTVTESRISNIHEFGVWSLQEVDVEVYIEKEIEVYAVVVKNHPMGEYVETKQAILGVFVCEGEVIGGTSTPYDPPLIIAGGPNSLHGKGLEEVTGMTYSEWYEYYLERFNK